MPYSYNTYQQGVLARKDGAGTATRTPKNIILTGHALRVSTCDRGRLPSVTPLMDGIMLLVLRLRRSAVWRHCWFDCFAPLPERHWAVDNTPSRSRSTAGSGCKQVRSVEHRFPHVITALLAGLLTQQRVCVSVCSTSTTPAPRTTSSSTESWGRKRHRQAKHSYSITNSAHTNGMYYLRGGHM